MGWAGAATGVVLFGCHDCRSLVDFPKGARWIEETAAVATAAVVG